MLHLSRQHPQALSFEADFASIGGPERFAIMLPLRADVPDLYVSLLALVHPSAMMPTLEQTPFVETLQQLEDGFARAAAAGAVADAHWAPMVLTVLSVMVREGLRIAASGALRADGPEDDG